MKDYYITPNFRLSEFLNPGDPFPSGTILENIHLLAQRLQVLRDLWGKPIKITSGYRTPSHNLAVGGKSNSYHVKGMAADFVVDGMTPQAVQAALKNWSGGLGSYKSFTHIDIRSYKARW